MQDFAADAAIGIEIDDAVGPAIERGHGADRHARRPIAVIAAHHAEEPPAGRELALLDVLDPGAIDADRHLMFALARHRAGMTTDALAVVDHETECRHGGSLTPADRGPKWKVSIWLAWRPQRTGGRRAVGLRAAKSTWIQPVLRRLEKITHIARIHCSHGGVPSLEVTRATCSRESAERATPRPSTFAAGVPHATTSNPR